jgi:CBS domain-containing membrane protein
LPEEGACDLGIGLHEKNWTKLGSAMDCQFVSDLMSSDVVSLEEHESLSIADRVMTLGRIRHMPVVDKDGSLVGLITQRNLLHNALSEALGGSASGKTAVLDSIQVSECMTKNPMSCAPSATLAEAAEIMLKHKYGCLPIVDGGTLVGILTESDFVAAFAGKKPVGATS